MSPILTASVTSSVCLGVSLECRGLSDIGLVARREIELLVHRDDARIAQDRFGSQSVGRPGRSSRGSAGHRRDLRHR